VGVTIALMAPMPGDADLRLLAAARDGDARARTALVRAHQGAVFALLQRMLRPSGLDALVEDLAQETFLRAFRALPRFDPQGRARLRTWLLTIATRLAINECKRTRVPTVPVDDFAETLQGPFTADRDDTRRRAAAAIARAISGLPPRQRAAFVLQHFHHLDHAAIANALEVPVGTVKSRLARARTALREALKEAAP
jgi:RNA polymerase sigma-70 factor (ECF subfamily)